MANVTPPNAPDGSSSNKTDSALSRLGRDRLARLVVVGSFLTIFALVAAMLLVNQAATETASRAFTTILPVLAGWVGSVLAYYFSAASLDSTTRSLEKAISGATNAPSVSVAEKMIPLNSIRGLFDLATKAPNKIEITELKKLFEDPTTSRLVFVEKDQFRYVMHQSALNAYQVKNPASATSVPPMTFDQMLLDADLQVQISKLIVFVKASATLSEAKDALGTVAGAQDIIVTTTGTASGSMLGWLTNVDLTKSMTA